MFKLKLNLNNQGISILISVILGSVLTFVSQFVIFKSQSKTLVEDKIYSRRIELTERVVDLYGQSPAMDQQYEVLIKKGVITDSGEINLASADKELALLLGKYRGEFMSVLVLTGCYFGDKTKEALDQVSNSTPFWKKDKEKMEELIIAMVSEINLPVNSSKICNFK